MADTLTIYGLQSKVGKTVQANIAGLDCGTYTVASDGTISVPYYSDPDRLLTADYLASASTDAPAQGWGPTACSFWVYPSDSTLTKVTVSVSVGIPYQTRGQRVRPDAQDDAKAQQGSALGVTRRAYQFAALIVAGVNDDLAFGTTFDNARTVSFKQLDANGAMTDTPLDHATIFSGVHWSALDDAHTFNGQLYWQTSAPQPLVIASVSTFLDTEER